MISLIFHQQTISPTIAIMGKSERQYQPPTEVWEQLELLNTSPQQRQYELIRPVVLYGQPAAERARETVP